MIIKKEWMIPLLKIIFGIGIIMTVIWGYVFSGGAKYMYELTCISNLAAGLILIVDGIFYKSEKASFLYLFILPTIMSVFLVTVICTLTRISHFNFSGGFLFMHAINPLVILVFYSLTYPKIDKKTELIRIFTSPLLMIIYLLFDYIRYLITGELIYGLIPNEYLYPWLIIIIGIVIYALLAFMSYGLTRLREKIFELQSKKTSDKPD